MFSNVIIGIDGRQGGRDAIAVGRALAGDGAQITLVHVWNELSGIASAATGTRHPAAAAQDMLEESRRASGIDCHVAAVRAKSVGAGLHEQAEELGADLIVVGTSRHQANGRVLLRDDTRASLHGAPCAVVVASSGAAHRESAITRVGVAYEPTRCGDAAMSAGRELAAQLGAELHTIRVVPALPSPWTGGPLATMEVLEELPQERAWEAREQLAGMGGNQPHVAPGSPVRELVRFSADVDLLIIGSRGHGPASRLLIGSTADGVTRDAYCSVLVVPRPQPVRGNAEDARRRTLQRNRHGDQPVA